MADTLELAKAYIQIVPTTKGIQSTLESELSGAGEAAGKKAGSSIGSGITSVAGGIAKAAAAGIATATTAVAGFAKTSVDAGMEFDTAMSQVQATMLKTSEEMESDVGTVSTAYGEFTGNLREFAQFLGSNTAFSATQAAEALNYMALAGYDVQQSMDMLPNVLSLAAAGGMDLATASDMVTDASSALGLDMEQTAKMVDEMAQAASKSNTSVEQLGSALLTVGGTGKMLVGGTNELSTALGILADNGIKGSEGGTALRNVILSLTAPVEGAATMMDDLGLSAFDAEGNMRPLNDVFADLNGVLGTMNEKDRINTLNTLFNKVDLKSVNALLANTGSNFDIVKDGLDKSGVSWDKYKDAVWAVNGVQEGLFDELIYNMQNAKWNAEDMANYLHFEYDIDENDAKAIVDSITASVETQSTRWDELSGMIAEADGAAAQMANLQLDNLSGDITLFQSALEGAKIAVSDGLTPVLREFVQFGTDGLSEITNAFNQDGLSGAVEAFGSILGEAVTKITEMLPDLVQAGTQMLAAVIDGIKQALPTVLEAMPAILESFLQLTIDIGKMLIEALPDVVMMIVEALPSLIPQLITGIVALFTSLVGNLAELIVPLIQALPDIITALIEGLVTNLPVLIAAIPKLVLEIAKAIPELIVELPIAIMEAMVGAMPDVINGICASAEQAWNEWIKPAIDEIVAIFTDLWGNITEIFQNLWDDITKIWEVVSGWFNDNVVKPVTDLFKGVWAAVSGFFENLWNDIVSAFNKIIGPWFEIVKTAFLKLKDDVIAPLTDLFKKMWNNIKDFADKAWKGIASIWNVVSGWFGDKVISPIKNYFSGMWENLKTGAKNAWEGIKSVFKVVADWFKDIFSNAWQKVKDVFSTGGQIFSGIKEGIVEAFKAVVNAIIRGINTVIAIPFNSINSILNTIRNIEILGIYPFTWIWPFSVPQIPELAQGGIISGPRLIMAGEDGDEAIVPLERNTGWIRRVAEELADEYGGGRSSDLADEVREISEKLDRLKIVLDSGAVVGGISTKMDRQLGQNAGMSGRRVAMA